MTINKLSPLELHKLFYEILEKLKSLDYVYDKKTHETHYDYFARHVQAHYDARNEIKNGKKKI